jgi:hypothetical protein
VSVASWWASATVGSRLTASVATQGLETVVCAALSFAALGTTACALDLNGVSNKSWVVTSSQSTKRGM